MKDPILQAELAISSAPIGLKKFATPRLTEARETQDHDVRTKALRRAAAELRDQAETLADAARALELEAFRRPSAEPARPPNVRTVKIPDTLRASLRR